MVDESIVARLRDRGAAQVEHPGGTLLAHLIRVAESLKRQGSEAWVVTAGLCHAAYGTAGFAPALFGLDERTLLASWIGSEAEGLVYLYGACDRREWTAEGGLPPVLRDRFDSALVTPPQHVRRALLELTVANELDVL